MLGSARGISRVGSSRVKKTFGETKVTTAHSPATTVRIARTMVIRSTRLRGFLAGAIHVSYSDVVIMLADLMALAEAAKQAEAAGTIILVSQFGGKDVKPDRGVKHMAYFQKISANAPAAPCRRHQQVCHVK